MILNILVYGNVIPTDNKYVYEIFFPIYLASIIIFVSLFDNKWFKNIILTVFLVIFFSNILILKKFNNICLNNLNPFSLDHKYKTNFGCKIIYANPFNLKTSFNFLKNQSKFSFSNVYVPGIYYGIMPSIINDMKVSEYQDHKKINQNQNSLNVENEIEWLSTSTKNINQDNNIKFLLLADLPNLKKLESELAGSGWSTIYKDINIYFNTISVVLEKNK